MGFWQNVDNELQYLGKTRKELALEADFDASYIPKGIARDGVPLADLALRIADALGVSLEYLLDLDEHSATNPRSQNKKTATQNVQNQQKAAQETRSAVRLYRKYSKHIASMEKLSAKKLEAIGKVIEMMGE